MVSMVVTESNVLERKLLPWMIWIVFTDVSVEVAELVAGGGVAAFCAATKKLQQKKNSSKKKNDFNYLV